MAYLNTAGGLARQSLRQGATVAAIAGTVPAGGTGAAAGGWDTANNRNTAITTMTEVITVVNAMRASLRAAGLLA